MDVIERLNKIRLERNLSVYRLSELTGINQSTLANTFSRGTIPSIHNLEIICNALGITLSQFFQESEQFISMSNNDIKFFNTFKKLPLEIQNSIINLVNNIDKNNHL